MTTNQEMYDLLDRASKVIDDLQEQIMLKDGVIEQQAMIMHIYRCELNKLKSKNEQEQ